MSVSDPVVSRNAVGVSTPTASGRQGDAKKPARKGNHFRTSRQLTFLSDVTMVTPAVLAVTAFVVAPVIYCFYLSMTSWNGFSAVQWVGFANYTKLFRDAEFLGSIKYTALVAVIGTAGFNAFGLASALLLNRNTLINRIFRFIIFYPYVMGAIVLGFLWATILGTNGIVNSVLQSAGAGNVPFIAQPAWARWTVIIVIIWASFGFHALLYLTGLQTIDQSLIEAAVVDGASPWRIFWRIKLPVIAPTVTLNITLALIGTVKVYEWILTLTNGGPAGATRSVTFEILSVSLNNSQLGYGSAQSIVLMIAIIALTVAVIQSRRKSEMDVTA